MPAITGDAATSLQPFQSTITSETSFAAVADIIPASDGVAIYQAEPGRKPLTFNQLKEFAASIDLAQYGLSRDMVICTAIPNGPEAAVCFWALTGRCVFAPLNPALTVPEIEFELTDLPAAAMIVQVGDDKAAAVKECCKKAGVPVIELTPSTETVGLFTMSGPTVTSPPSIAATAAEDLALVLHTSGTTKKPKIVPLTHDNLGNGIQFVARTLRRTPQHTCLNIMPLFHIHGLIANVGASIYSESSVVCASFMGGRDFLEKCKAPAKNAHPKPTWYSAVPTMHEAILLEAEAAHKKGELAHSLTLMRNCSAALLPPVSKRFLSTFGAVSPAPFTVVPTYAMTESFPICSNPPHLEVKLSTVGPAMGPTIKILKGHPEDEEVEAGAEGEVCVCGPCVTSGYLMREHMSADPNIEAFSTPTSAVGRMLRTGDKGYLDADGYLQLVGRFKEIINCGGDKISPLELEDMLLEVPGVETCVCFATPAQLLGEVVACAVVPKEGMTPPTLKDLRAGLTGVTNTWLPKVLVLTNMIPKGSTGKPKRIGLAKMWNVPVLPQLDMETYTIKGLGGEKFERLTYMAQPNDYFFNKDAPVFQLPMRVQLDVSPDLGPTHEEHSIHELVVEDEGGGLSWDLKVTTFKGDTPFTRGEPFFRTSEDEVLEVFKHLRLRAGDYGLKWTSGCTDGGPSTVLNHDWCGVLTVWEGGLDEPVMRHEWPNHCTEVPPGALMRLLKLLDLQLD